MKIRTIGVVVAMFVLGMQAFAQAGGTKPKVQPTPQATVTPEEYSRRSQTVIDGTANQEQAVIERLDKIAAQLLSIGRRLDRIEAQGSAQGNEEQAKDDKSKKLLTNLDIITKGEQRVESLRKQLFQVMEKESALRSRIDQLDIDARSETIEKSIAFSGSLRPEELRDARRKSIEAERRNTQLSLVEIQSARATLESTLAKAEALVERLRQRFEKDIEGALNEN